MRGASYRPRILVPHNADDLAAEIELIGAAAAGVHRILPKCVNYVLKLHNVPAYIAHVLKESFLAVGADAAISRKTMTDMSTESTDVILVGSRKHFSRATKAISEEEIGGPSLASEIEGAIAILESGPLVPGEDVSMDPRVSRMFETVLDRTLIMGILNVTPDSFSDGGAFLAERAAVARGIEMAEQGADIIDVGGESTRPGSEPVSAEEEIRRVVPVITELSRQIDRPISIDTYKAAVADSALSAGAVMINDISAMTFDPDMRRVAAERRCPVVLMHIKGTPRDMQKNPAYVDLMGEIAGYLWDRIGEAVDAGIDERMLIIDPGFGFGKTAEHNLTILQRLKELRGLGRPVLVGVSRKSTIGHVLGGLPPEERLEGTAAAVALSIAGGANIVRVHDVREMVRVAKMADAVVRSE